jgi:hypothetical protein
MDQVASGARGKVEEYEPLQILGRWHGLGSKAFDPRSDHSGL